MYKHLLLHSKKYILNPLYYIRSRGSLCFRGVHIFLGPGSPNISKYMDGGGEHKRRGGSKFVVTSPSPVRRAPLLFAIIGPLSSFCPVHLLGDITLPSSRTIPPERQHAVVVTKSSDLLQKYPDFRSTDMIQLGMTSFSSHLPPLLPLPLPFSLPLTLSLSLPPSISPLSHDFGLILQCNHLQSTPEIRTLYSVPRMPGLDRFHCSLVGEKLVC